MQRVWRDLCAGKTAKAVNIKGGSIDKNRSYQELIWYGGHRSLKWLAIFFWINENHGSCFLEKRFSTQGEKKGAWFIM